MRVEAISSWFNTWTFILFLLSIPLILFHKILHEEKGKRNPGTVFVFVWGVMMLASLFGQNRWAYYLAVNIAINVAYVLILFFDLTDRSMKLSESYVRVSDYQEATEFFSKKEAPILVASMSVVLLFVSAFSGNLSTTVQASHSGGQKQDSRDRDQ